MKEVKYQAKVTYTNLNKKRTILTPETRHAGGCVRMDEREQCARGLPWPWCRGLRQSAEAQ